MIDLMLLIQCEPLTDGILLTPNIVRSAEITSVTIADWRDLLEKPIARGTLVITYSAVFEQLPNAMTHIMARLARSGVAGLVVATKQTALTIEPRLLRTAYRKGLIILALPHSVTPAYAQHVIQAAIDSNLPAVTTHTQRIVTNSFLDAQRRFATEHWLTYRWSSLRESKDYIERSHLTVGLPYRVIVLKSYDSQDVKMLQKLFREGALANLPYFTLPDLSIATVVRRTAQVTRALPTHSLATSATRTHPAIIIGVSRRHILLRSPSSALIEAERAVEYGERHFMTGVIEFKEGI